MQTFFFRLINMSVRHASESLDSVRHNSHHQPLQKKSLVLKKLIYGMSLPQTWLGHHWNLAFRVYLLHHSDEVVPTIIANDLTMMANWKIWPGSRRNKLERKKINYMLYSLLEEIVQLLLLSQELWKNIMNSTNQSTSLYLKGAKSASTQGWVCRTVPLWPWNDSTKFHNSRVFSPSESGGMYCTYKKLNVTKEA